MARTDKKRRTCPQVKILLFGATGMVGAGALLECLADPRVESVLAIGRSPTGRTHPKLREVTHPDFFAYDDLQAEFAASDACFFCLGVSSVGMSEAAYTHLTYDLTLAAARAMVAVNPRLTFCYVTGAGTDSSEQGRTMWARVKGRTENALLALPFKAAFMFRPAFIQPVKGVRSKTRWYQALYTIGAPLSPVLHRLFPKSPPRRRGSAGPLFMLPPWGIPSRFYILVTSTPWRPQPNPRPISLSTPDTSP